MTTRACPPVRMADTLLRCYPAPCVLLEGTAWAAQAEALTPCVPLARTMTERRQSQLLLAKDCAPLVTFATLVPLHRHKTLVEIPRSIAQADPALQLLCLLGLTAHL
jgi:hypothetical protein